MQHNVAAEAIELDCRQTQSLAERSYEQDIRVADGVAEQAKETVDNELTQFDWLRQQALSMLRKRRLTETLPDSRQLIPDAPTDHLLKRYRENARRSGELLGQMKANKAVRFVDDGWPILVFIGAWILFGVVSGFAAGFSGWIWAAGSFVAALITAIVSRVAYQAIGCRQTAVPGKELYEKLSNAATSLDHAKDMIAVEHRARYSELEQRRDAAIVAAKEKWELESSRLESQRRSEEKRVTDELTRRESASHLIWDRRSQDLPLDLPADDGTAAARARKDRQAARVRA